MTFADDFYARSFVLKIVVDSSRLSALRAAVNSGALGMDCRRIAKRGRDQ